MCSYPSQSQYSALLTEGMNSLFGAVRSAAPNEKIHPLLSNAQYSNLALERAAQCAAQTQQFRKVQDIQNSKALRIRSDAGHK